MSGVNVVRCRSRLRSRQHGAALILGLALLGIAVLTWRERSSLSQLLMAQQSLDQATAAAALTASQFHARRLNAHAFLNRTMMAHRVAMAHLLTIASAEKMRIEMSQRATRGNPPVYLIGMIFGPQHATAYAAAKLSAKDKSQRGIEALHRAFQAHDKTIHNQLLSARQSLLRETSATTERLVREALERNLGARPDVKLPITVRVINPMGALGLVIEDPTLEIWSGWFDDVIKKHHYLQTRRQTKSNYFWIHPRCPLMFPQLRRRGSTELAADGTWQATDTLSFHKVRGAHTYLCYWREYPMGWANIKQKTETQIKNKDKINYENWLEGMGKFPTTFATMTFLRWAMSYHALGHIMTGMNNLLADGWGLNSQIIWQSRTLAKPFVLKDSPIQPTIVQVTQPIQSLRSSLLHIGLRLKAMIETRQNWGHSLVSTAAAQAYFDRFEERFDRHDEAPNLFQPFWLAKQVPVRP